MSMPLPIHVALICATSDVMSVAKKLFRLSAPGIGPAYYVALDAPAQGDFFSPKDLPTALITLWLCLDQESFALAKQLHAQDLTVPRYGRGFYDSIFPEPCLLIENSRKSLSDWSRKIVDAWYETS